MTRLIIPRRSFLIGAAGLIACPAIVRAQIPITGAGLPKPATGGGGATFSYQGSTTLVTAGTTSTFTSVNIGAAAANRVVSVLIFNPLALSVSSVTIGGSAATQATTAGGQTASVSSDLWYLSVASGTTATIVATFSGSLGGNASTIAVAAIGTATPTAGTGSNGLQGFGATVATTVTIPATGVAFSGVYMQNADTISASNWTLNDTIDPVPTAGGAIYIGHQTTTGTNTITPTGGSNRMVMSTVPWGP